MHPQLRKVGAMRILNVTAQKPDSTGSGVYLAEMVKSEQAQGHTTAVLCGLACEDVPSSLPSQTKLYAVRFDTPELPFHVCGMSDTMPYLSTRYRDMNAEMTQCFEAAFQATIALALREFQPDLIICHHLYLVTALVREMTREMIREMGYGGGYGCPVVGICHSTDLRQLSQHGLERERIISAIRSLDAVFALHNEQAQQIHELFSMSTQRIHVIGTGFNSRVFCKCEGEERQSGRLVYAGKIWRKKGVECLLHALAHMQDVNGLSLHLAGGRSNNEEEYQAILKAAASCGHEVRFLGRISQEELAHEYRAAQLFVLPSFYEGLPLVAIEALSCGCQVVMTELAGIRPWIESNVENAPITWVRPPKMQGLDEPLAEELAPFEERLAAALRAALQKPMPQLCIDELAWDGLVRRVLSICSNLYDVTAMND